MPDFHLLVVIVILFNYFITSILHFFFFHCYGDHRYLHVLTHSSPTRRSSDRTMLQPFRATSAPAGMARGCHFPTALGGAGQRRCPDSESLRRIRCGAIATVIGKAGRNPML